MVSNARNGSSGLATQSTEDPQKCHLEVPLQSKPKYKKRAIETSTTITCHPPSRDIVPDESTLSVEELNRRLMLQNVQRQFDRHMSIFQASRVPEQFLNHINEFLEVACPCAPGGDPFSDGRRRPPSTIASWRNHGRVRWSQRRWRSQRLFARLVLESPTRTIEWSYCFVEEPTGLFVPMAFSSS